MIALYVLQLLLVAAALGLAAWSTPRAFASLAPGVRAMMAMGLAPLALAVFTLGLAALWPGAPRQLFQAIPGTLSLALIVWLVRRARPAFKAPKLDGLDRIAAGIVVLALITAVFAGLRSAGPPAAAHDMLIYLTEAKAFAQNPSLASIPTFEATPGEVIKAHPHQFLFQSYLAQALMFADGPIGYPNDLQARFAIQATLPLIMLGLFGLARTVLPTWTAALAPPLMLFFHSDYVSVAGSIDAFRLGPFVVAVGVLIAAVGRKQPPTWQTLLLLGSLSGLTVAIHSLNIVIVAIVGVSVVIGAVIGISRWRSTIYAGIACVPFLIMGLADKIYNLVSYGTPLGPGMYYFFYAGTPLEAVFNRSAHWMETVDPITAFWRFSLLAGPGLMIAAALSALCMFVRHSGLARGRPAMLGLMTSLVIWIPLVPGLGLQGAMLSNLRYGLAASALAAVALTTAAAILIKWATAGNSGDSGRRFAVCGALGAFIAVASGLSWLGLWSPEWVGTGRLVGKLMAFVRQGVPGADPALTLQWAAAFALVLAPAASAAGILAIWRWLPSRWTMSGAHTLLVGTIAAVPALLAIWTTSMWTYPVWSSSDEQATRELVAMAEVHAADGAWVVDDYTIAYYSTRPPLFLYAGNGAPLLQAADVPEARRQLAIENVRMVALRDQREEWWPSTAFFQALNSDPDVEQRLVGNWRVFLLRGSVPNPGTEAREM